MSIKDLADLMTQRGDEIKAIEARRKVLEKEELVFLKDLIGEVDREIIKILVALGTDVKEYDVDGVKWHLIEMKHLGWIKKGKDKRGLEDRIITSKLKVPYRQYREEYVDTFYPYDLLGSPSDSIELSEDTYYADAWMLTDCRGHRIHTKHSYEGYRATPHWYIHGWMAFERVEDAIRAYVEELCREQTRRK